MRRIGIVYDEKKAAESKPVEVAKPTPPAAPKAEKPAEKKTKK